jgi:long-subunit fatty acid transport protein
VAHDVSDKLTVSVNAGVGYDFLADRNSITTTYAGAPGAGFTTYGNAAQHWVGRGGVGAAYKVNERVQVGVRYDAEARKSFSNQTASAEVRWAF